MKTRSLRLIFVTVFLASMLFACTSARTAEGDALAFTSFAQGETNTSPAGSAQSGITVISDAAQLSEAAAGLVDASMLAQLQKSIEAGQYVVIVYAPEQSASGYRISVKSIEVQDSTVKVLTTTGAASDARAGNQVLSYPHQIILVEKSKIPAGAKWELDNTQSAQPVKEAVLAETPTQELAGRPIETEIPVLVVSDIIQEGVTSIARGESLATQAPIEKPTLMIATKLTEAEAYLPGSLDPAVIEQLKKAPEEGMLIVVIYRGMMSTGGYGVAAQSVTTVDGQVIVSVMLTEPEGQMANQVISYPYEILLISTSQVPAAAGTIWKLIDTDGNLLTQTTYP